MQNLQTIFGKNLLDDNPVWGWGQQDKGRRGVGMGPAGQGKETREGEWEGIVCEN